MKSFFWAFINQVGSQAVNVLLSLILTFFLKPDEFGVFAMVTILTDFSHILTNLGFGQSLVKKSNPDKTDMNTVFWINIVTGIVFSTLIVLCAKPIASFYDKPQLETFIYWIPIGYMFSTIGLVSQYMLIKAIRYKEIFIIYIVSRLISGGISIYMAYKGFGVWSLLVQHILTSILIAVLSFTFYPWKPSFQFSVQRFRIFSKFSFSIFGNETIAYVMDNIDKAIIGKFLNDFSLGLYARANSLTMLPVNNFPRVIDKFLFPYLSKKDNPVSLLDSLYTKWFGVLAYIIIPVMLFFGFLADDFVAMIFTKEWYGLAPLIKVIALAGLVISFSEINNSFFLLLDKAHILFRINLVTRAIIVAGLFAALPFGVIGIAWSLVITNSLRLIVVLSFTLRYLELKFVLLFSLITPPLIISIFAITVAYFIKYLLHINNGLIGFCSIGIVVVLFYAICSHLFKLKAYTHLRELMLIKKNPVILTQTDVV